MDLACGTGPRPPFHRYRLYQRRVDINQPMLDKSRHHTHLSRAQFSLQDMCGFAVQPADLITCFLYSIHTAPR